MSGALKSAGYPFKRPKPDYPAAFKLVYQVLSEGSHPFQRLVNRALEIDPTPFAADEIPFGAETSSKRKKAIERASQRNEAGELLIPKRIPRAHPFQSTLVLKKHILPVLQSQNLIYKRRIQDADLLKGQSSSGESDYHWFLRKPPASAAKSSSSSSKDTEWSIPEHWRKLLAGAHPGQMAGELKQVTEARQDAARQQRLRAGVEKRSEREIWDWEGRNPDLTTNLQRLHLNRRNRKNRTRKELATIADYAKRDQMVKAAKKLTKEMMDSSGSQSSQGGEYLASSS